MTHPILKIEKAVFIVTLFCKSKMSFTVMEILKKVIFVAEFYDILLFAIAGGVLLKWRFYEVWRVSDYPLRIY